VVDSNSKAATIATMATAPNTKPAIVSAKEAKNHFGELLEVVQRQPVVITKNGRPVAIMIRHSDRHRFNKIVKNVRATLDKRR